MKYSTGLTYKAELRMERVQSVMPVEWRIELTGYGSPITCLPPLPEVPLFREEQSP